MPVIVVVDDRVTNRALLTRMAQNLGEDIVVYAYGDPDEALAAMVAREPDLVITDYVMPNMNGAEFVEQCRKLLPNPDLPIIVVTVYEERAYRYRALEAGATDFLLSPVDPQEFSSRARNLLALGHKQQIVRQCATAMEEELRVLVQRSAEGEAILQKVVDAVPALVVATDHEGVCLLRGAYASRFVKGDATIGQSTEQLFGKDYATRHQVRDAAVLAAGAPSEPFEEELTDTFGQVRTLLTHKAPLLPHSNKVVTVSLDLTERKAAERDHQERLRMEIEVQQMQRASESQNRFFAAASHDLRQPFQAMCLFHEVLSNLLAEPDQIDVARNLGVAINSGKDLLEALLDISTLEVGTVTPNPQPIELRRFLDNCIKEAQPLASEKGLDLRLRTIDTEVHSDPILLRRIVGNLIVNAIRYTQRGGVLVTCRARQSAIELAVWDTGVGIPADKQTEIFEDFLQLHNSARDRAQGLGLGLSIVKRSAALLGIGVQVKSKVATGSRFILSIPVRSGPRSSTERELVELGDVGA